MSPEVTARARVAADFQARWHDFVARWRDAKRQGPEAAQELVGAALRDGLPEADGRERRPPPAAQLQCARHVVGASGLFDAEGYVAANRVAIRRLDPLTHFCDSGWRELRTPSLGFDLWWYWTEHLDPTDDSVNPLLHYLLVGRRDGLAPVPPSAPRREPTAYPAGTAPRRVCLFAGYDRDGLVDDYVVAYLRDLARFADVYYLADGVLEPGQLQKLDGIVADAWSIPHAAYDFGSFSALARDLVGWERIGDYDELILANDSCFLLRPLDEVFAAMDARACDWWSLQATSNEYDEQDVVEVPALPLAEAKARFIGPRRWREVMYLHLSSYFMVFRRPVLEDPGFRWRLDTVRGQADKQLVILKYEVGLSRYLMDRGLDFATFIDELYPFHPLYSRRFFELVERGFPLVKRNFLAENPRGVPGLGDWPQRLTAAVPDAPLAMMRANIDRVGPADRGATAYDAHVEAGTGLIRRPRPSLVGHGFRSFDRETASHGHWWAFPVSAATDRLDPGAQALFDQVRDDPTLRKVLLYRSRRVRDDPTAGLEGENVTTLPLMDRSGQAELARCGRIVVDDTPTTTVPFPLSRDRHDFVHVGVGLPLVDRPEPDDPDARKLRALVVSSRAEAWARTATSRYLDVQDLWLTGLPRHDLLLRPAEDLPAGLVAEEARLRALVGDRRLVVWWPSPGAATPGAEQVEWLGAWARRNDVVVGVREPRVDDANGHVRALSGIGAVNVSGRAFGYGAAVHRVAAAVVTDTAVEAADVALLGRPLLIHRPDLEGAAADQDPEPSASVVGPHALLSGLTHTSFDSLAAALEDVVRDPAGSAAPVAALAAAAFEHTDGHNAWRVAQRLRALALR